MVTTSLHTLTAILLGLEQHTAASYTFSSRVQIRLIPSIFVTKYENDLHSAFFNCSQLKKMSISYHIKIESNPDVTLDTKKLASTAR